MESALTHTSYHNEKDRKEISHFQRLEFLGDSVLNLCISEFLYTKFPFFSEGELSKIKSFMISQTFLVKFASYLNLYKYIKLGKSVDLDKGRGKFSILADCLEACLGAIYLDGGLNPCKKMVIRFITYHKIDLMKQYLNKDYKTYLQEATQKNLNLLPTYKVIKVAGLDHQKDFQVVVLIDQKIYGKGIGKSKKEAEQKAAFCALKKLDFVKKGIRIAIKGN